MTSAAAAAPATARSTCHSSGTNPVGRGLPITGGTLLHPTFDVTLTFPQFSQAGSYSINLDLIDNVFNHASFTPAALAVRGLPPPSR